jgi:predicted RNase H-like HicB family nuclease
MNFTIELEQEDDGRWIAEVIDFSGVLAYGQTREEAITRVKALAYVCSPTSLIMAKLTSNC